MKWQDCSEIVTGLALNNRLATNAINTQTLMPPYDKIVGLIKEGKSHEEIIEVIGLSPVQSAFDAEKSVNGTGSKDWIKILEDSYQLFSVGQQLERTAKKMQQGELPDISNVRYQLSQFDGGKTGRKSLADIESSEIPFIKSGWQPIDDHLGGFPEVGLIVVAGNPGVGKTSWMAKVATRFAMAHLNKRVAVYSLEMILEEVSMRFHEVEKEVDIETQSRIDINCDPLNTDEIIADAARVEDLGLVIIDFADYLVRGEITESSMGMIYRTLSIGSKLLHCPIILLAQLNRTYGGGIPRPRHIRYTSLAEILAWMLIMLYNPETDFYEENEKDKEILPVMEKTAYMIAWKVRGGFRQHPDDSPGAIATGFTGSKGWFTNKSKWFSLKKEI